jgi:hypothetical protein
VLDNIDKNFVFAVAHATRASAMNSITLVGCVHGDIVSDHHAFVSHRIDPIGVYIANLDQKKTGPVKKSGLGGRPPSPEKNEGLGY